MNRSAKRHHIIVVNNSLNTKDEALWRQWQRWWKTTNVNVIYALSPTAVEICMCVCCCLQWQCDKCLAHYTSPINAHAHAQINAQFFQYQFDSVSGWDIFFLFLLSIHLRLESILDPSCLRCANSQICWQCECHLYGYIILECMTNIFVHPYM